MNLNSFIPAPAQQLHHYKTKDGKEVIVVSEYNKGLGIDLIRFWQIDGVYTSSVRSKYWDGFLDYDASNSLIGERKFEFDSITYEFLIKPLNLDLVEFNHSDKRVTSFFCFNQAMERAGAIKL